MQLSQIDILGKETGELEPNQKNERRQLSKGRQAQTTPWKPNYNLNQPLTNKQITPIREIEEQNPEHEEGNYNQTTRIQLNWKHKHCNWIWKLKLQN